MEDFTTGDNYYNSFSLGDDQCDTCKGPITRCRCKLYAHYSGRCLLCTNLLQNCNCTSSQLMRIKRGNIQRCCGVDKRYCRCVFIEDEDYAEDYKSSEEERRYQHKKLLAWEKYGKTL